MSEASEARAVAEALIQQVPYRDKLTELIKEHTRVANELCQCGWRTSEKGVGVNLDAVDWEHAEHLTKIIRGHLRQTRVVTAPPPIAHSLECECYYCGGGV